MNLDNLHKLIDKYEESFYELNNAKHDEIFKWRAMKRFRDVWFSPEAKSKPFSEMFNEARKEFFILMDNSYVSPSNGIVKIAEIEQDAVANLFNGVLFAADGGDIVARQNNMELFLDKFDELRLKYYPQSFKFKQDRHSASCYLFFYAPDTNYIYRYSEAEAFAQHIEFGKDIGSGQYFRLDYYYEMCDKIVEALKEHQSLLEKHFAFLSEKHYKDESLHLLAFDVMYCCRAYNFYNGMLHITKKESIKAFTEAEAREKERIEKENKIEELQNTIFELEMAAEKYAPISLLNVEVVHHKYGKGIITSQEINKVNIKFDSCEKGFVIHKKYASRPTFENDSEIVEAMSEYDDAIQQIKNLRTKIDLLLNYEMARRS